MDAIIDAIRYLGKGIHMGAFVDLTGQRFERLVVIGVHARGNGRPYVTWRCRCDCGKEVVVKGQNLTSQQTKSCGCFKQHIQRMRITGLNIKHGHSFRGKKSRTYICWQNMIQRCSDPNTERYNRYGGRGIIVCARWQEFNNFLEDMGQAPKGCEIDRIDYDGNYELTNCRWVTRREQANNRSDNRPRPLTLKGITRNLSEWAHLLGLSHKTISNRLNRGWSVERALLTKQGRGSNQFAHKPQS